MRAVYQWSIVFVVLVVSGTVNGSCATHENCSKGEPADLMNNNMGRLLLRTKTTKSTASSQLTADDIVKLVEYTRLPSQTDLVNHGIVLNPPEVCTTPFVLETMTGTLLFSYTSGSPSFCCWVCYLLNGCKAARYSIDNRRCDLYKVAKPKPCDDCRHLCKAL